MRIVFRDEMGMVAVDVDEYGIQFGEGIAYFSDGEKDYKVDVSTIVCIDRM